MGKAASPGIFAEELPGNARRLPCWTPGGEGSMMDKRVRRRMDFTKRYNPIELLAGGVAGSGVQSYRAMQMDTGREVAVHLLLGGKTPENEALLARLRAMQPHSMAKLVEVGEYQGNTFIVTVAPPYQRLEEWLAEQDRAAAVAEEFGKAGFWKRPEAGSLAAPPSPVPGVTPGSLGNTHFPPPPPAAAAEAGEFTRMFQSPGAPPSPVPGVTRGSAGTTQAMPLPPPARPVAAST